MYNVVKTIINYLFGNGLYHLFKVVWGMVYYCFNHIATNHNQKLDSLPTLGDGHQSIVIGLSIIYIYIDLGKFNHDRTLFSRTLESWLVRGIIPKWPQEVGGLNSG